MAYTTKSKWFVLLTVALLVAPLFSNAQQFQRLFDDDSTQDWGWCMLINPDSNYFICGWSYNPTTNKFSSFDMTVDKASKNVFSRKLFKFDTGYIGPGSSGEMYRLHDTGYITPLIRQWPNATTGYLYSAGGIMKLNASGDTTLVKTYTDTSMHYDVIYTLAIMQDGGYLLGGGHGLNTPSHYPGYLIRTNALGDTLWTKTFQRDTSDSYTITNIIPLADGRIVVAATFPRTGWFGSISYTQNVPWFLLLDQNGNIIKDSIYSSLYMAGRIGICGNLYSDINGGYVFIGVYDSIYSTSPVDFLYNAENFPAFIAHLDTNFDITWITSLSYSDDIGHRQPVVVRQTKDSSYIIVGDDWNNISPYNLGFAAKIDRNGNIIWSHNYFSSPLQNAYFRDAVEESNHNLIFIGAAFNDTLPTWHRQKDVWLVGVDSNGCEVAGCNIKSSVALWPEARGNGLAVYPNPNTGTFVIQLSAAANEPARITVTDITGRTIKDFTIPTNNDTPLQLNQPGMYFVTAITEAGRWCRKVVVQ